MDEERLRKIRRRSALVLLQNSKVLPFKVSSGFSCFYCDSRYGEINQLRTHNIGKHNAITEREIKRAMYKLRRYQAIHVNVVDVACKLCEDNIENFDDLKRHLSQKHKKELDHENDGVLPFKIENGEFECALCRRKYPGYHKLSMHMNEHYANYICEQCGVGFMTPERLKNHSMIHQLLSYPCGICSKVYRSENSKRHHHRVTHRNERSTARCPHCTQSFLTYYGRQKHIQEVHGIKVEQYQCEMCPQTFLQKSILNKHTRTVHMKETRFSCELCDQKYYGRHQLRNHMACHAGGAEYQCTVCKKTYPLKAYLNKHMRRIHQTSGRKEGVEGKHEKHVHS